MCSFDEREDLIVLLLEVCSWDNVICGQRVIEVYWERIRTPGCLIRGIEGCMRKTRVGRGERDVVRIELVEKGLNDLCVLLHGVVWGEEEHHFEERRWSISYHEE
jgi:hypothetical protein